MRVSGLSRFMGGSGGEEQFQRRKGSSVMKSLVVYSSKSGNTKRVAEAVARGLGEDTVLATPADAPDYRDFDFVAVGFWIEKERPNFEVQKYLREMADAGCDVCVMEVSSQALMLHRVGGIMFDYGLFTNISPDHIGPKEHKSFEEYLFYKSRLLTVCKTGIVNRLTDHYDEVVKDATCRLLTYALNGNADFMGDDIHYASNHDFVGIEFSIHGMLDGRVRVGMPGKFNADNALAALAVCTLALSGGSGVLDDHTKQAILGSLVKVRVDGRMEIAHVSKKCSVIVDYAHNAVSMESLLTTLRDYHPKRLVCVFGCGGNRARDRRYSMGEIGGKMADLCIITADNPRFEKNEDIIKDIEVGLAKTDGTYLVIPDRQEAIFYAIRNAEEGDMIAIIGKGHEDYQEIEGVKHHFLDREVVEEAVKG